jgi:hydrogenase nickel incorporation protein HypA/HybF
VHEMALVASVVDLVVERTAGRQVTRVRLQVGELTGVLPDAMSFCFDVAVTGTPLDGAELDVDLVAGRVACHGCGAESACPDRLLLCPCGSADVEVIAGEELTVVSVDLVKEAACA